MSPAEETRGKAVLPPTASGHVPSHDLRRRRTTWGGLPRRSHLFHLVGKGGRGVASCGFCSCFCGLLLRFTHGLLSGRVGRWVGGWVEKKKTI